VVRQIECHIIKVGTLVLLVECLSESHHEVVVFNGVRNLENLFRNLVTLEQIGNFRPIESVLGAQSLFSLRRHFGLRVSRFAFRRPTVRFESGDSSISQINFAMTTAQAMMKNGVNSNSNSFSTLFDRGLIGLIHIDFSTALIKNVKRG
jgi:hypothetical protein